MSSISRAMVVIFALTIALGGCVNQPANVANNTPANNSPATTQASPATVKINATDDGGSLPVTLPVLDAFFADETFAPALKSRLRLTDDEVERLRTMAREETMKLRESDADDYTGTTSAARTLATDKIKAIIGEAKSQELSAFLRERWNGDEGAEARSDSATAHGAGGKFNAVPGDTRVVVNAPAYRMDVFRDGQLVKSYKVGIGYPEFPLPTGMRKATTIIFNPTWTPPDEPWVETANKVKPGQKIEAGSKLNPLGPIKIPIGLPSLIHGGKSPAKLGGFASHGCVGLTTPQVQDFARRLAELSGTALTDEEIAGYAKNPKETKDVKLARPVTIELRYETIVVEDGRLHIYRDVYDRDTNTEENLRNVLASYNVTLEQLSEAERSEVMNALKEMSRDAAGRSDETKPSANSNTSTGAAQAKDSNKNGNKKLEADAGRVTRAVKGRKEVVIEIAALKGKGYPAPAEFDTGSGAKKQPAAANAPKGKRS